MYCIFCDFIAGKRNKGKGGFPFLPLYETNNTVAFLSVDLPVHEYGHTLIIPKRHFESIEKVPQKILHELIDHVSLVRSGLSLPT